MLDILLIGLGSLCMVLGLAGCFLPAVPGPPLGYAGLLLLHITQRYSFTTGFLLLYAILTIVVVLLDYLIPVIGAKGLGGSKYGVAGSGIGLVIGIFLGIAGIVFGPVLGAFAGEVLSGKKPSRALKPALGSFLGFLAGTGIKLVLSLVMAYHFAAKLMPKGGIGNLF